MTWVMIALLNGSLVVSQHDNREACMGRMAVVQKDDPKVSAAQCVSLVTGGNLTIGTSPGWTCSGSTCTIGR